MMPKPSWGESRRQHRQADVVHHMSRGGLQRGLIDVSRNVCVCVGWGVFADDPVKRQGAGNYTETYDSSKVNTDRVKDQIWTVSPCCNRL